jgi:ubiquinone/menaquinone biosynthesis C-methylase UbiE
MCALLPVYQENIDYLLSILPQLQLPQNPKICDLGAGTGNYITALANKLPNANFVHLDMNKTMNAYARQKYLENRISSVRVIEDYIERVEFPDDEFDLVICINALNTASPQLPVLQKVKRWLKPDARLFLIDFGRKQRVLDWGWYILKSALKRGTLNAYIKALSSNREAIKQNRLAARDQSRGYMWTHTLSEFQNLVSEAGFDIDVARTCYRGYCDMIVAINSVGQVLHLPKQDITH